MENGWDNSADAWIAEMGDHGDFGRRYVLDNPMLARVHARAPNRILDLGCGEGRFCRLLAAEDRSIHGIDPTRAFIARARSLDPTGDYQEAWAERLPFETESFDTVIAYLSLIDIADLPAAITEVVRVLRPGGTFLIANLTPFNTASLGLGWTRDPAGREVFAMDQYLEVRSDWASWRGVRIRNWHRPLGVYMTLLLDHGLILTEFCEPEPSGGPKDLQARYRRAPWFFIMEWAKPASRGLGQGTL